MSDYLKEAKELEARWKKTGLLNGITDKFNRASVAVLLENQRLMNENPTNTDDIAQFKRISIPLIRRLHPQLYNHPIQATAADLLDAKTYLDAAMPEKTKKQLRSLDDEWDA